MGHSLSQAAIPGTLGVLIPHCNDITGLNVALASLATENAAFSIVDDGRVTPPDKILLVESNPYLASLHIIFLVENIDLADTSDYDYIAHLDCGDASLAKRLGHQAAYLDNGDDCH